VSAQTSLPLSRAAIALGQQREEIEDSAGLCVTKAW
jgi:hypothetical protein